MKFAFPVLALFLAGLPAAHAANPAQDPIIFQSSYDQEAMGHNQEALATLDQLSPEKNASYVTFLRKGWLHHRLGKYAAATLAYTKAIALAPKAIEPRLGILLPLLAEKRWSIAQKHARDILKVDPENYLATLRLAFALYSEGKFGESRGLYQKIVDNYPGDLEARAGLGWALLKLGKSKEAATVFKTVLDFSPKNTLAQQGLAALAGK
jgi:tetratricopeptide (TPR) repeat protein